MLDQTRHGDFFGWSRAPTETAAMEGALATALGTVSGKVGGVVASMDRTRAWQLHKVVADDSEGGVSS
jgi:hypothetical protein